MRLGFGEIVTVLALAMLLFGPSRLPALGASLGEAIRGFKRGLSSRSLSGWNFASLRADDHARLGAAARAAPSAGPRPEQTQTRTSKCSRCGNSIGGCIVENAGSDIVHWA
jgi:sec-independent protein translocase protein TatA